MVLIAVVSVLIVVSEAVVSEVVALTEVLEDQVFAADSKASLR